MPIFTGDIDILFFFGTVFGFDIMIILMSYSELGSVFLRLVFSDRECTEILLILL